MRMSDGSARRDRAASVQLQHPIEEVPWKQADTARRSTCKSVTNSNKE